MKKLPFHWKTAVCVPTSAIANSLPSLMLKTTLLQERNSYSPPHEPGLLPAWLAQKGVTDVIAGGMGQRALDLFAAQNINVNVGAQTKKPGDLVNEWINKTLQTGANVCDH
jgi:predicted Fe-Mo cluster-binding NifX family protein